MSVELRGVTKRFGGVRVLVGVDASFPSGRVAVVTGANGSGKSTLLAIVGTLMKATSGAVSYGALGDDVREVRRRLAWLGHDTGVYADLTGRENLRVAAQLLGVEATGAVDRADARFGLTTFLDRPVRTYSRGQRQRLALARVLVHRPAVILLDEPTSGLDAGATARLVAVVREEAAAGATVLVSTHEAGLRDALGADGWVLGGGALCPQG
jgi:heme exporter protein A